jgi:hypothetical protein
MDERYHVLYSTIPLSLRVSRGTLDALICEGRADNDINQNAKAVLTRKTITSFSQA